MPLTGIGFGEMMVIAMLVLIVFGPKRLPEITRSVGKAMREFKRGMNEIQRELEVADRKERWGSSASNPPAAASTPAGAAVAAASTPPGVAAAAATAATASATANAESAPTTAESDLESEAAAGTVGETDTLTSPEPVIAPPTFGSDLPEEIEAQLAPSPADTAVAIPVSEPMPDVVEPGAAEGPDVTTEQEPQVETGARDSAPVPASVETTKDAPTEAGRADTSNPDEVA